MSLFIRLDCNFFRHRKTLRLRALIGDAALWVPPALWAYAAEHQPDGNMAEYNPTELALAIGYAGDAPSMLQAMLQACFLDPDMKIHNWEEHNGYHALRKEKARNAAIARWEKERSKERGKEQIQIRTEETSIAPSMPVACSKHSPIIELRARVGSLFQRDPQAPWGYDEEYALVSVAGREHVLTELAEIEAFWKSGDYLPQKLSRLLDGWTGVLDRARGIGRNNGHVKSGRPATVTELKTILGLKEEKAATLKAQFASEGALSTDWTDESRRQEFVALRREIKDLKGRIEKMPV